MRNGMTFQAVALLLATSCVRPRTEVIVTVASEVSWGVGQQIQSVVLTVRRGGSTGRFLSDRTQVLGTGEGQQALPFSIGVIERSDDLVNPIWVEALGCRGLAGCSSNDAVVAQRAVVRFVPEQTRPVTLLLASACVGARCARDQRCTALGACEDASLAQPPPGDPDAAVDGGAPVDAPDGGTPRDDGVTVDVPTVVDLGTPVDAPVATAAPVGSPCVEAEDCASGICFPDSSGYPGGMCAAGCPGGSSALCGPGGICVVNGSYRACGHQCRRDNDCRAGYFCLAASGGSICQPRCTNDPAIACGEGRCNPATEQCENLNCSSASPCSPGSRCDIIICRCTASTNCGAGRHCLSSGSCGCLDDRACAVGGHCNPSTGGCS